MTMNARVHSDHDGIIVHVPLTFTRRGGRKQIVTPDGSSWTTPRARVDNTMVKAIARAFRWRKLLEAGVYSTIQDIAVAEKINASYISRTLRLTLLAPNIVEAILDGRQGPEITLAKLVQPFPVEWGRQQEAFTAR